MLLKNFEQCFVQPISNNEMTREEVFLHLKVKTYMGHTPILQEEEEEEEDRWGSYTNPSSSRSALQPHSISSALRFGSFTDFTLQTNLRTHPPSPLGSSSSSFTHSKTSGASRFEPTLQTHHQLNLSLYGLSSKITSSPAHPKQSSTSCSQSRTTQIRPKLCINPRSDDALDLVIPAKLKIQVPGDQKQVSARLEQYSSRIEEKEQTIRVVGKHWWDYRSCEEEEDLDELKLSIEVRWIQHYSSKHKILLVGEGDFSFSAALALSFVSATNITATSLDSIEFVSTNYSHGLSNVDILQSLGAVVMHNVDATKMANIFPFKYMLFDRLVYNFPLAGFFPYEKREDQICRNQKLVQLFLENAKEMIPIDGEIHITHKSNGFFKEWDLEFIASRVGLQLVEEVPFNFRDYPGYRTKYGFGGDNNFNCNPSKTYKFGHKKQFDNPSYRFMKCCKWE